MPGKRGRRIYSLLDKVLYITPDTAVKDRSRETDKENPISRTIEAYLSTENALFRAHVSLLDEHIKFYRYENSQWEYIDKFPTTSALEDWLKGYYEGKITPPIRITFFHQSEPEDKDDERIWVGIMPKDL